MEIIVTNENEKKGRKFVPILNNKMKMVQKFQKSTDIFYILLHLLERHFPLK